MSKRSIVRFLVDLAALSLGGGIGFCLRPDATAAVIFMILLAVYGCWNFYDGIKTGSSK